MNDQLIILLKQSWLSNVVLINYIITAQRMASWLYKLVVFGGTVLLGWGVMKATEQSPEKMKKVRNLGAHHAEVN